jgi:PncC family amidohydrolase
VRFSRTGVQVDTQGMTSDTVMGGPVEEIVGRLLLGHRMKLAVAESCTGGLVMHRLTNIPGSSRYLLGGVVAYANEIKIRILGVPEETLTSYGAVSAEAAQAMAEGVRRLLGTDVALAVTGIAGPTGDTPDKPVGLTYVALATPKTSLWRRYEWAGSRLQNKEASAEAALRLLQEWLSGSLAA